MLFKLIVIYFISFYYTNMPYVYDEEGIYQINKLEYSYTNGYGINQNVNYKIDCEDNCILYIKEYESDENNIIKIKLSDKEMDKFEKILNRNHVLSWKGFSKYAKDVLDGDSFSFSLRYNDDEKLSASGYMMYPSHYREFKISFEEYVISIKNK